MSDGYVAAMTKKTSNTLSARFSTGTTVVVVINAERVVTRNSRTFTWLRGSADGTTSILSLQ